MPTLDIEAAANAIRSRFNTEVHIPRDLVVEYDNSPPTDAAGAVVNQPTNGIWCAVSVLEGDAFHAEFGAPGRFRTPGVFVVQIFTPILKGDKASRDLADFIIPLFRSRIEGSIVWKTPSARKIGRDALNRWYQINITCPFHYDM